MIGAVALVLALLRVFWIVPGWRRSPFRVSKGKPVKSFIILGSGGHTAEMLRLVRGMDPALYSPRVYVKASTDTISADHCRRFEALLGGEEGRTFSIVDIPRARQVGQPYWSSIGTTLIAFRFCLSLLWRESPDLVRQTTRSSLPLTNALRFFATGLALAFLSAERLICPVSLVERVRLSMWRVFAGFGDSLSPPDCYILS